LGHKSNRWRKADRGNPGRCGPAALPEGARLEFLDLAPDGRHLLYAQYDQSGSNIMMVEDFR
jgi:hypothetical protein